MGWWYLRTSSEMSDREIKCNFMCLFGGGTYGQVPYCDLTYISPFSKNSFTGERMRDVGHLNVLSVVPRNEVFHCIQKFRERMHHG